MCTSQMQKGSLPKAHRQLTDKAVYLLSTLYSPLPPLPPTIPPSTNHGLTNQLLMTKTQDITIKNLHTKLTIYPKKTWSLQGSHQTNGQHSGFQTPGPWFDHHPLLPHFVLCTIFFQRINSYNNSQLHPTRYKNKKIPRHKDPHPNGLQLVLQITPAAVRFPLRPTIRPFC